MARVNEDGYIVTLNKSTGRCRSRKPPKTGRPRQSASSRDWHLIKCVDNGRGHLSGYLNLSRINLPERYIGRKVRLKLEVID